jgi:hypothetical protein
MSQATWLSPEEEPDEGGVPGPQPLLFSLHFMRNALVRSWRVWVSIGIVGMLLGIGLTLELPAKNNATATLLLAHDKGSDPALAMATDVSLLSTRTLAATVTAKLGLTMTPEAFIESFTARAATNEVLVLTISAPTPAQAVARAKELGDAFLTFRATQMRGQTNGLVDGYNARIEALQSQVEILTGRYNTLSAQGPTGQAQAADVLTQRSQISEEVSTLQQTVEDATLRTTAVVSASHVLDPARSLPPPGKKRAVLNVASGLIGGLAIGIGLVLFLAVTSGRLRRREEVATALGAPVRVSVGRVRPARGRLGRLRERKRPAAHELDVLVQGLESGLRHRSGTQSRYVLGAVDSTEEAAVAVAALTARLIERGSSVFLVDLTAEASLAPLVGQTSVALAAPTVFRPEGVPSLSQGPLAAQMGVIGDLPSDDPLRGVWDRADIVITLAEVDPAVGTEHLASWGNQIVLLVTAGRSSAELLRTAASLIRNSGLTLMFAVLLGADRTDESVGLPDTRDRSVAAALRRTKSR